MKLSKVTVLAIIFIGVTLLFAVLGSFNINPSVEGFKDDVVGCTGEIVPECHSKVLNFAGYSEDYADDYILKTEVVYPAGTTCPSYYQEADIKPALDDGVAANAGDANGESDKVDDDAYKLQNPENEKKEEVKEVKEEPKPQPVAAPATYTPPPTPPVGLAGSATPMAAAPSPVSTPAPCNDKPETPPCPACERCPEPAFECKKVPNYRSPSMQNYMPLPVLNDFSKF
jgi:hypothetical protein